MTRSTFQLQRSTQQRTDSPVLGRITTTGINSVTPIEVTSSLESTGGIDFYEDLGITNFERINGLEGVNVNNSIARDFISGSMIQPGVGDLIDSMYDYVMSGAQSLLSGDPYVPIAQQPYSDGWYVDYEQTIETESGTVTVEVSSAYETNGNSHKGYDTSVENNNGTAHYQRTQETYDSEGNLISSSTTNEYFNDTKDGNGDDKREEITEEEYESINSGQKSSESNEGGWFDWIFSWWEGSDENDKGEEGKDESGENCFEKPWLRDHFLQPGQQEIDGMQVESLYEIQKIQMGTMYMPLNDIF